MKFEIEKHLGELSSNGEWTLEANLVSWNGRKAKIDIRKWSDNHQKMSKGICLSDDEVGRLIDILNDYNSGEFDD